MRRPTIRRVPNPSPYASIRHIWTRAEIRSLRKRISRSVVVADAPTEFQSFVESSVGKRLPIFGYNLFQGVPSTFAPLDRIAVPANYVIGPGDQLLIRAWGQIDVDASVPLTGTAKFICPKLGLFRLPALAMNSCQTTSRMP